MIPDDPDKTMFRQPKPGGDRTVMRPRSGDSAGAVPQQPPVTAPPQPHYQPGSQPDSLQLHAPAVGFGAHNGLNPLVSAASTLLAVFEKVKQSMSHPDVAGLHQRLVNEIRLFEQRVNEQGLPREMVLSARYLLCSALDDAILNTPWGSESPWAQRTLLSFFHNEAFGGEKSFVIIDRMSQRPAENLHFVELAYICLSLGFEGRYRLVDRGRDKLEQIRDELFRIIRNHRGDHERTLSPSWHGLGKIRNTLAESIPLWVVASCVAAVLFFGYSGFRYWLYQSSNPVVEKLTEIARVDGDTSK